MTAKHDFKEEIKEFDLSAVGKDDEGNILFALSPDQIDAHNKALRLADRLHRGAVSEEMVGAGYLRGTHALYSDVFKTMAAQMIKEEAS